MDNPSALIEKGIDDYLSTPVANWKVDLQPSENHWDKRIEVTAPVEKGGMYVVEATLDGGVHRARCSLWVNDLSIVYKPVEKEHWFYVADAVTGAPMSNLTVEFIGIGPKFTNVARKTNAEGQVATATMPAAIHKRKNPTRGSLWRATIRDAWRLVRRKPSMTWRGWGIMKSVPIATRLMAWSSSLSTDRTTKCGPSCG